MAITRIGPFQVTAATDAQMSAWQSIFQRNVRDPKYSLGSEVIDGETYNRTDTDRALRDALVEVGIRFVGEPQNDPLYEFKQMQPWDRVQLIAEKIRLRQDVTWWKQHFPDDVRTAQVELQNAEKNAAAERARAVNEGPVDGGMTGYSGGGGVTKVILPPHTVVMPAQPGRETSGHFVPDLVTPLKTSHVLTSATLSEDPEVNGMLYELVAETGLSVDELVLLLEELAAAEAASPGFLAQLVASYS